LHKKSIFRNFLIFCPTFSTYKCPTKKLENIDKVLYPYQKEALCHSYLVAKFMRNGEGNGCLAGAGRASHEDGPARHLLSLHQQED
jgi:hypothetical protein